MFTGIVEGALTVRGASGRGDLRRIEVDLSPLDGWRDVKLGDSVALNGCCLTVAELNDSIAVFEAIPETLRLTSLAELRAGRVVNVERAMRAGARFDGHLVQGHVDAVGEIKLIKKGDDFRIRIHCGREFAGQCIHKGSVCVDGISLTIAELDEESLVVAVIPHTREVTNIRDWKPGTPVNLEADVIGKYVQRQLAQLLKGGDVGEDLLRRAGFVS